MSTLRRPIGATIISTPTSHGMGLTGPSTGDGTHHGTGTAGMTPIGHGAGVRRGVGGQAGAGVPHGVLPGVGARDGAGGLHGAARHGVATLRHIVPVCVPAARLTVDPQGLSAPADVPA